MVLKMKIYYVYIIMSHFLELLSCRKITNNRNVFLQSYYNGFDQWKKSGCKRLNLKKTKDLVFSEVLN